MQFKCYLEHHEKDAQIIEAATAATAAMCFASIAADRAYDDAQSFKVIVEPQRKSFSRSAFAVHREVNYEVSEILWSSAGTC